MFAMVVATTAAPPASTATKVYRVFDDTTGRRTSSGAAVANSLTALGADQITVGIALNATDVVYDVWAITVGLVPPFFQ